MLASGELVAYGEGEHIPAFEAEVSTLFGKEHGVMVNSESSANRLAVKAADLPPGSEVVTSAVTFITTVAPVIQSNLVPVFTDVGMGDYQVDVDQVEDAITEDIEAIYGSQPPGERPGLATAQGTGGRPRPHPHRRFL